MIIMIINNKMYEALIEIFVIRITVRLIITLFELMIAFRFITIFCKIIKVIY